MKQFIKLFSNGIFFLFCIFFVLGLSQNGKAQDISVSNNIYNFNVRIGVQLENMNGDVVLFKSYASHVRTAMMVFPNGFKFNFCDVLYDSFSVSSNGNIALGTFASINDNFSPGMPQIIAPFHSFLEMNNLGGCSYKMVGNYPNRKLVIQWDGLMSSTNKDVKFQLWLFERTNLIQMVYEKVPYNGGYYNIAMGNQYYSGTPQISNYGHVAVHKSSNIYLLDSINNYNLKDSISNGTSFIFSPDTLTPVFPGISVKDSFEGSALLYITDLSDNETDFELYKQVGPSQYTKVKTISSLYVKSINSEYRYQEDGFKIGDTVYYLIRVRNFSSTPKDSVIMVVISRLPLKGKYNIPYQFSTIGELLKEVRTMGIAGDVIIELDSSYKVKNEKLPILFDSKLKTAIDKSITLRPALNNLNLTILGRDSQTIKITNCKYINIDGRPGGVLNTGLMILRNRLRYGIYYADYIGSTIELTNASNINIKSCVISCSNNIGYDKQAWGAGIFGWSKTNKDSLNDINISRCKFEQDSLELYYHIAMRALDSTNLINRFSCDSNEFNYFGEKACIYIYGAVTEGRFTQNHFYSKSTTISLKNWNYFGDYANIKLESDFASSAIISNNYFGGSQSYCTGSKINIGVPREFYNIFINSTTDVKSKIAPNSTVFINDNIFANFKISGDRYTAIGAEGRHKLISIMGNRFGSLSSSKKVVVNTYAFLFIGTGASDVVIPSASNIDKAIVSKNIVGGVSFEGTSFSFIYCSHDTSEITENILGDSSLAGNIDLDSVSAGFYGISSEIYRGKTTIRNNIISYWKYHIQYLGYATPVFGSFKAININCPRYPYVFKADSNDICVSVDSNEIHHLALPLIDANATYSFINIALDQGSAHVFNNNIYANWLQNSGDNSSFYSHMYCISLDAKNGTNNYIYNNSIKNISFYCNVPGSNYISSAEYLYGISAYGALSVVYNNMINLGPGVYGNNQKAELSVLGLGLYGDRCQAYHNSVYLSGADDQTMYTGLNACLEAYCNNLQFYKNILFNNRLHDTTWTTTQSVNTNYIYLIGSGKFDANYNLLYYTDTAARISNQNKTMQGHHTQYNTDYQSKYGNPKFTMPIAPWNKTNLHPVLGSMADKWNTKNVFNITNDLDGLNRDDYSPTDIGCYALNFCPSTLHEITASDTQICSGSKTYIATPLQANARYVWLRNSSPLTTDTFNFIKTPLSGEFRLIRISNCKQDTSAPINITIYNMDTSLLAFAVDSYSVCTPPYLRFRVHGITTNDKLTKKLIYINNVLYDSTTNDSFDLNSLKNLDKVSIELYSLKCGRKKVWDSKFITINLSSKTPQVVISSSDTNICDGSNISISANSKLMGVSPQFYWYKDNILIDSTNAGIYNFANEHSNFNAKTLLVSSDTGCLATKQVWSNILSVKVNPTIFYDLNSTFTDTQLVMPTTCSLKVFTKPYINAYINYQWYKEGIIISGATDSFLLIQNELDSGHYLCRSWTECSDTFSSKIITVTVFKPLNIIPNEYSRVKIFPNPCKNEVYVWNNDASGNLEIYDSEGKCIESLLLKAYDGKVVIPMGHLNKGIYLIRFYHSLGNVYNYKLVKME